MHFSLIFARAAEMTFGPTAGRWTKILYPKKTSTSSDAARAGAASTRPGPGLRL